MEHLRKLWLFNQVIEAGSFSEAARRNNLSVAAISKHIAQLESAIGAQLLIRTTRSLKLTVDGQQLYDNSRGGLNDLQVAMDKVTTSHSELTGLVRLSVVTAYGRHAVIPLLPGLFERYPDIRLDISFHDAGDRPSRFADDIHITWGEEQYPNKVSKRLSVMPLVLVASPQYLERYGSPSKPEDLGQHQCIVASLPTGVIARWIFRRKQSRGKATAIAISPKGQLTIRDELDTVIDAAVLGLGITVVTEFTAAQQLQSGKLQRVLGDYELEGHSSKFAEIVMQFPKHDHMTTRVRAVADFFIEHLQEQ